MTLPEFLADGAREAGRPGVPQPWRRFAESVTLILRVHNTYAVIYPDAVITSDSNACTGCGFDNREETMCPDVEDCPVLRALAWAWRDNPQWQPTWIPEGAWDDDETS
jgi:hypothetical protein